MNKTLKIITVSIVALAIVYFGLNKFYFGAFFAPKDDDVVLTNFGNKTQVSVKGGRFINDYFGFNFKVPEEWKKDIIAKQAGTPYLLDDKLTTIAFRMASAEYFFLIAVSNTPDAKKYEAQTFSDEYLNSEKRNFADSGGEVLDAKITKLNGDEVLYFKVRIKNDPLYKASSIHYYYTVLHKTTVYKITASSAEKDAKILEPQFSEVMESIEFI